MGSGKGHQAVPPIHQILAMTRDFPTMQLIDPRHLVWRGPIEPTGSGIFYTLEVHARGKRGVPKAWIRKPNLVNKPGSRVPPHCFVEDRSLCLYQHRENPWQPDLLVAETIIPWACGWVLFYEQWLETGVWLGPEYDHAGDRVA